MSTPTQEARLARPVRRFRTVQVRRVEPLAAHMLRITFGGDELAGFEIASPGQHIKVLFPLPGQAAVVLPQPGPDGRPEFPAGQERPPVRTFTPRRFDPDRLELDVDFAIHGDGPASTWASSAAAGATVAIAGPGGGHRLEPAAAWYVLAGDETALPAMATILEALPPGLPVQAFAEVGGAADQVELPLRPTAVHWLHRGPDDVAGTLLDQALRAADLPPGHGRVWVACEAAAMRNIRRHLLYERGLHRDAVDTRGYWKHGESNHPDHDRGEEI